MTTNDSHNGITIGARVRITHRPELDGRIGTSELAKRRAKLNGCAGQVAEIEGWDGGVRVVAEIAGSPVGAWFDRSELQAVPGAASFAPVVPRVSGHGDTIRAAVAGLEDRLHAALDAAEADDNRARAARQEAQQARDELASARADLDALRAAVEGATGMPEGLPVHRLVVALAHDAEKRDAARAELAREVEARKAADVEARRFGGALNDAQMGEGEARMQLSRVAAAWDAVQAAWGGGDVARRHDAEDAMRRALAGVPAAPAMPAAKPEEWSDPWSGSRAAWCQRIEARLAALEGKGAA